MLLADCAFSCAVVLVVVSDGPTVDADGIMSVVASGGLTAVVTVCSGVAVAAVFCTDVVVSVDGGALDVTAVSFGVFGIGAVSAVVGCVLVTADGVPFVAILGTVVA